MTWQSDVLEEVAAASNGLFWIWHTQEEWLSAVEPTLANVVEENVYLDLDLRTRFAAVVAEDLDDLAEFDDDGYMLWRGRENFIKLIEREPAIENPCKVWRPPASIDKS